MLSFKKHYMFILEHGEDNPEKQNITYNPK